MRARRYPGLGAYAALSACSFSPLLALLPDLAHHTTIKAEIRSVCEQPAISGGCPDRATTFPDQLLSSVFQRWRIVWSFQEVCYRPLVASMVVFELGFGSGWDRG